MWETDEIDAEIADMTSISAEAAARGVTKALDAEVVESVNVHGVDQLGKTVSGSAGTEVHRQLHHHHLDAGPRRREGGLLQLHARLRLAAYGSVAPASRRLRRHCSNEKAVVDQMSPEKLIADMEANSGGLTTGRSAGPNASRASVS